MSRKILSPRILRRRAPWQIPLYLLLIVFLTGLIMWFSFEYGRNWATVRIKEEPNRLRAQIAALQQQNAQLRNNVAKLDRSGQIDRQATLQVRAQMRELQGALRNMKEELNLYRGIIAPAKDKKGLQIYAIKLHNTDKEREYKYNLILTQVAQNNKTIKGTAKIFLEGRRDDAALRLSLEQISPDSLREHKFEFRFYQNLEGLLNLPGDFTPERLTVEVMPAGKNAKKLVKAFDWVIGP